MEALLSNMTREVVSAFISEFTHLLDDEGHQQLMRNGGAPERRVMTGIRGIPVAGVAVIYQKIQCGWHQD